LNKSTRLAHFLLKEKKVYEAVLRLGVETDTQDATGQVIADRGVALYEPDRVHLVFTRFLGMIQQQPPTYSALKHNGRPLYSYARNGQPVYKPPRQVHIYKLRIINIALPEIHFEVVCSAGTYIRTLCADIGRQLGCGGHLKQLRRLSSGGFSVTKALDLETLEKLCQTDELEPHLIPMTRLVNNIPRFKANHLLVRMLIQGRLITTREIPADMVAPITSSWANHVQVVDEESHLIAVLVYRKERGRYDYCCVFPNGNAK
jgi:tRNA pseudouridine55 synthase